TSTPSATPSPTRTATPTPTAEVGSVSLPTVFINEFLAAPRAIDFDHNGIADRNDEYIELYNPQTQEVVLAGWWLDDAEGGSAPYAIPAGTTIAGHGFLLFFRSETGIALNNRGGDSVRLLAPDHTTVIDQFSYTTTSSDTPWSRTIDGAGSWTETYPPSPGGPNLAPTATATATTTPSPTSTVTPTPTPTPWPTPALDAIKLNEILPAPKNLDWDQDGTANSEDEWIELVNLSDQIAYLGGWQLWKQNLSTASGIYTYTFPDDTILPAHDFLVIFRRQSRLYLPGNHGDLRLLRADGSLADQFVWNEFPDYDRSFSRYPDGVGSWGRHDVTIGRANRAFPTPRPTPPPPPAPIGSLGVGREAMARAYQLAADTKMTVEGIVTVPPGVFGPQILYVQDESAGLKLYLREGHFPSLRLGDRVRATGYLRDFYGQRELNIPQASWLLREGGGSAPQPRFLRTGNVNAVFRGQLLLIVGRVSGFAQNSFVVDDGSGEVTVWLDSDLSWTRPYFESGSTWAVMGVVAFEQGRFVILPRFPDDISPPPAYLPTTGADILASPPG
ncbi:MAG: hypothetical protein GXP38_00455, partial [Chloroflexi bacterium]|nr:hypothetical protein [Chloroflexota bacterium]